MTVLLVAVALVAAAGAIAALAASEPRLGLVALVTGLIGASLIADPLPSPAVLGVRLTAALLAVATLRMAAPPPAPRHAGGQPEPDERVGIGWPGATLLFAAGAATGIALAAGIPGVTPVVGGSEGPAGIGQGDVLGPAGLSLAAGFGLLALALPVAVTDHLGPRRAIAAMLLVESATLLRAALAGPPGIVEEVVLGTLLIAVAAAAALLVNAARVREGAAHQP